MDKKVAAGVGIAVLAILLLSKNAAAAAFICPYGDGLTFKTLAELQAHVEAAHPGERIPITIIWS